MGRDSKSLIDPDRKHHSPANKVLMKKNWSNAMARSIEMIYFWDTKTMDYGYTKLWLLQADGDRNTGNQPLEKKKLYKLKPYQRAAYPGQKLQLDVKYVPSYCVADGEKYYQFTAKDECSRWTFQ